MVHEFFLAVPVKAAARTQATCRGRFAQVYTAPTYRAWLDLAVPALAALKPDLPSEVRERAVSVDIEAVSARPKTTRRSWPRGDNDNLEKGVWDAMTKVGGWWVDDDQIIRNSTTKRYAVGDEPEGYRVRVEFLEPSA